MRSFLTAAMLAGCLSLAAGGVLLVRSHFAETAPARIEGELEFASGPFVGVANDGVLVLRNKGGRTARLINVPGG